MPKIKDAEWNNHSSDNASKAGSLEGTGNRSAYSSVPDAPSQGKVVLEGCVSWPLGYYSKSPHLIRMTQGSAHPTF